MARTLLSHHQMLATADLDEARAEVGESFCPHGLSLTRRDGQLDVVHNAARIGGVGLNYLRYGDEVRITPRTFETFFLVQIPLAGRARVRTGRTTVLSDRHTATLPSPTEPIDMVWSADCEQLIVYLDRSAVESYSSTSLGGEPHPPVVFDPRVDLAAPAVRSWLRLVTLAREELDDGPGLLAGEVAAAHYEQLLIAGLLAAQPNSSTAAPAATAPPIAARSTRTALDLIEAQPERAWRVGELATAVGVSSRTLQAGFHRDRGVSPLEELRRVRLDRAHADLAAGGPESLSVTEVACRWGFFHVGRFAQSYRARYDELPSQTLAR